MMMITPTSSPTNKGRGLGTCLRTAALAFCHQRAGHRHHRNDHEVAADQHRKPARRVVPERIAVKPANAEPLFPVLGRIEIHDSLKP